MPTPGSHEDDRDNLRRLAALVLPPRVLMDRFPVKDASSQEPRPDLTSQPRDPLACSPFALRAFQQRHAQGDRESDADNAAGSSPPAHHAAGESNDSHSLRNW